MLERDEHQEFEVPGNALEELEFYNR